MFLCGGYEEFYAVLSVVPRLIESFKTGGGVKQSEYPRVLLERSAPLHCRLA